MYINALKGGPVLLSNSQAGLGRNFSQPRAHLLVNTCTLSYVYKGHVIRDTLWRLVEFLRKIRDILVLRFQVLGHPFNTFLTLKR